MEKSMSLSKVAGMLLLVLGVAFGSRSAYAVRLSSANGQGSAVDTWMVFGRSVAIPLTADGKKVTMTREIICAGDPDQDEVSEGGCTSGIYVYLFQFQSTSTDVLVNIGDLEKGSFTSSSGGANVCDDADNGDGPPNGNDMELCTEYPTGYSDNFPLLSGITFTVKSKTAAQFCIPSFPDFEAGVNAAEGQGVTLYVQTQQSAEFPIAYPTVGISSIDTCPSVGIR